MQKSSFSRLGLFLILLTAIAANAYPQATRTWVSGVGDDANPCSRTAPCKTFAGAISKTAAGGEISALDPAGYGAVTITKAITIDGAGTLAGILAAGTNGIIVNAGVNDVVIIRNVSINGVGTGINGIRFLAGGALHVENCSISRFTALGIDFQPSGNAQLFVKDSVLNQLAGGAILIKPAVAGSAQASLDTVRLEKSAYGLRVEDRSKVTVRDSVSAGNTNNGFLLFTASAPAELNLESSVAANNGTNGVKSEGVNSIARITNITCVNNNVGLSIASGATIESFGNNRIRGNPGGSATPNVVVTQQ